MSRYVLRGLGWIATAGVGLALALPAAAQTYRPYRSQLAPSPSTFETHIMGGYSGVSGLTSDYLQGGWVIDGGFTYWPQAGQLGIRTDLSLSSHNATQQFIEFGQESTGEAVDYGNGSFTSLAVGPVFRLPALNGRAQVYGMAQAGLSHVQLRLAQTFYVPGYYCDPFFGYCDIGYGVGDVAVYDYSTTKLGWNVGVGMEFPSYWGQKWFIEAQYRRVETQHPLEYWPITIGLRF